MLKKHLALRRDVVMSSQRIINEEKGCVYALKSVRMEASRQCLFPGYLIIGLKVLD